MRRRASAGRPEASPRSSTTCVWRASESRMLIGKGALANALGDAGTRQRPGRDADEARCACQRDLRAHQRVGRSARRDAFGGAGAAVLHTLRLSARALSAAFRSARRLIEHRRQRFGRQHLLRIEVSRRGSASRPPRTSCSRAARRCARDMRSTGLRPCWCCRRAAASTASRSIKEIGEFMLTHPNLRVPETTAEFAINASNSRHWEPAIRRYVNECLAGQSGPRGTRLQHALDRLAGGGDAPHPDARRGVHVSARP